MNLPALRHLLRAAQALAEDRKFIVMGSASLLASFPALGEADAPLAATYDADFLPEPFEELTATMLDEALGEDRAYCGRHGYHADILRDSVTATLPTGWRERFVPVSGTEAMALDPHDLAAVKLPVARPRDLALVRRLLTGRQLDSAILRARVELLPVPVERLPRLLNTLRSLAPA